ncbi:MAG: serine/threonine-protein kinase [Planctomycetota bacterium]|jgi:serine/threonine protein kinase
MNLSADAISLGLRLMAAGHVPPTQLAEHLRAVAAGSAPDHLVALQERILAGNPGMADVLARLEPEPRCVLLDCQGCRARFRAPRHGVGQASYCPMCGEAVATARRLLVLEGYGAFVGDRPAHGAEAPGLLAAEGEARYAAVPAARRFAHFELVSLAGRGEAGRVYEARNVHSGRKVALKVLDRQPPAADGGMLRRLRRQARVASGVVHEHVVRVFDLGVAEGILFIEMEFVGGAALSHYVQRLGPLPAGEACRLCREMLSGLSRVHREGVVHRDVRPGNILMDEGKRAHLTDFCLSRLLAVGACPAGGGPQVGSPHFMAPEQWRGEALSARTDVYAAALVLYFALTGRLPYEGESRPALMHKHLHEPLLAPDRGHSMVPGHLAQVIRRATAKAPADRFESAEALAAALRGLRDASVLQQ